MNIRFIQFKKENRAGSLLCDKCRTTKYFNRLQIQRLDECVCSECLKKDKPKPVKPKIVYVEKIVYCKLKQNKKGSQKTNNLSKTIEEILEIKIRTFSKGNFGPPLFTVSELLTKIGSNPKCYLTNDIIDLSQSGTYQLDHIIPRSKGGLNTLDNCGLVTKRANMVKHDLELDELVTICKKILSATSDFRLQGQLHSSGSVSEL